MTSKIKVDNIENQCGGAVVTKCGGTTTISGTVVKSNTLQASDAGNIISQSGTTITLGASGDTINLASGASQSGFGRTGTVDWQTTPKTATFTAVSGEGYFCNTSGGAFTVNLPAGVAGAIVSLADYAGTWQTSNVTVAPNGTDKIGSTNANATLSTEGQSVTFVFVDSTQGWINTMDSTSNVRGAPPYIVATGGTITTVCTNFKVHTFTGPGTFTVCSVASSAADNVVSHVVVAGGGGGAQSRGGGGGAGGYREVVSPSSPYTGSPLNGYPSAPNRVTVTATAFPITVGGGGGGGPGFNPPSANGIGVRGSNSIFSTVTSTGGGGGAPGDANFSPYGPTLFQRTGLTGGSGGGGGSGNCGGGLGGAGNTPPVSPAQGFNGGDASGGSILSAGGGGATVRGTDGAPGGNGNGGAGATSSINGTPTARAGGAGGGAPAGSVGAGGAGGGAAGSNGDGNTGTTNTGGGGGGAGTPGCASGGGGGSGIVIIRYKFQ